MTVSLLFIIASYIHSIFNFRGLRWVANLKIPTLCWKFCNIYHQSNLRIQEVQVYAKCTGHCIQARMQGGASHPPKSQSDTNREKRRGKTTKSRKFTKITTIRLQMGQKWGVTPLTPIFFEIRTSPKSCIRPWLYYRKRTIIVELLCTYLLLYSLVSTLSVSPL